MSENQKRTLLAELRKAKGTQHHVANELEISRQYLSMIESGARNPTVKLMVRMEKYFGIPSNSLFPDLFFEKKCHKTKHKKKPA